MKGHASIVTRNAQVPSARARITSTRLAGWSIRRIRRSFFVPPLPPTFEEAERRMRSHPGFIASLTAEQIAILRGYDGPEAWGGPADRGRTC